MRRQLSTSMTFFYKFIFPGLWLSGFAMGTLAMFVNAVDGAPLFAVITVIGLIVFWRFSFPLKRVIAVEEGLLISNFATEELIPYSHIVEVNENKLINIRPITLRLRQSRTFGDKIVMAPYWHFMPAFWKDHPVTTFLKERIEG